MAIGGERVMAHTPSATAAAPQGSAGRMNFAEYEALAEKVDAFAERVKGRYPGQIACRAGCSECCRKIPRLTLSPVEAYYLREGLKALPEEEQARLREASKGSMPPCPILTNDACLLYRNRPMLCRTFGYPTFSPQLLQIGQPALTYCYKNFTELRSPDDLDRDCIMNVDRVSDELFRINAKFVQETWGVPFDRTQAFTVQQVLQGALEDWRSKPA